MRIFALILTAALAAAPARAAAARVCGLASGESLSSYSDSVSEAAANLPMAAALDQMGSFPDVKALVAAFPGKVCVTAIPLSKNIYQYYKYLVVLSFGESGKTAVAPMIFQAASVQAYENAGPKPWLGFGRGSFARAVAGLAANVQFTEAGKLFASPADLLPAMYPSSANPVDPTSRSYVLIPGADPEWTTYVVSQLRFVDTGNPFTSTYIEDAGIVQVQERAGRTRWAPISLFSAASAMEDEQWNSRPQGGGNRVARLVELSRGAPATTPTLDAASRDAASRDAGWN